METREEALKRIANKELVLKYLSMALPYNVKLQFGNNPEIQTLIRIDICNNSINDCWTQPKPYLRVFEDMTEEEKVELLNVINKETQIVINQIRTGNCGVLEGKYHFNSSLQLEWILKNHFDIMDLVPNNLAIKVTKENNPYK